MDCDLKGEISGYRDYLTHLCALNKGSGTEVVMLAEWVKHEMVLTKILTDHLLQSLERAGLTLSNGGTTSLESL